MPLTCPTCHSDDKEQRFLIHPVRDNQDIIQECADEWHEEERHGSGCVCPDHNDEPYQEQ